MVTTRLINRQSNHLGRLPWRIFGKLFAAFMSHRAKHRECAWQAMRQRLEAGRPLNPSCRLDILRRLDRCHCGRTFNTARLSHPSEPATQPREIIWVNGGRRDTRT